MNGVSLLGVAFDHGNPFNYVESVELCSEHVARCVDALNLGNVVTKSKKQGFNKTGH